MLGPRARTRRPRTRGVASARSWWSCGAMAKSRSTTSAGTTSPRRSRPISPASSSSTTTRRRADGVPRAATRPALGPRPRRLQPRQGAAGGDARHGTHADAVARRPPALHAVRGRGHRHRVHPRPRPRAAMGALHRPAQALRPVSGRRVLRSRCRRTARTCSSRTGPGAQSPTSTPRRSRSARRRGSMPGRRPTGAASAIWATPCTSAEDPA